MESKVVDNIPYQSNDPTGVLLINQSPLFLWLRSSVDLQTLCVNIVEWDPHLMNISQELKIHLNDIGVRPKLVAVTKFHQKFTSFLHPRISVLEAVSHPYIGRDLHA